MKLLPGYIVHTNYGTGPYEILEIRERCTCPTYLDKLNGRGRKARPPHMHFFCEDLRNGHKTYLTHYVWTPSDRLMCLSRPRRGMERDEIIIDDKKRRRPVQLGLFG